MIGGVGGGASQEIRITNRYQILEDDLKAPFAGRSSLGGPPQSGRVGNQDYTGQCLKPLKVFSSPLRMVIEDLTPFAHRTPVRFLLQ
jgi:hypothetical protein